MRRVAIIASASGNGKTTLGARSRPGSASASWSSTRSCTARTGRRRRTRAARDVAPIVRRRLGDRRRLRAQARHAGARRRRHDRLARPADARLAARLIRRSSRVRREELWNGNRETWRDLWGRESLIGYALTQQPAPPRMARAARATRSSACAPPTRSGVGSRADARHDFADHVIRGVCGRGGMGIVYRATHVPLDREVALKVITPEYSGDQEFRRRFRREFRAAARVQHPNVIPIYHAGEHEGLLYVTMRYVDGTDLARLLAAEGQARARARRGPDRPGRRGAGRRARRRHRPPRRQARQRAARVRRRTGCTRR